MKKCWPKCLLVLLLFVILEILLYVWRQEVKADQVSFAHKIDDAISYHEKNKTPYIDFSEITDFPWDSLYIFVPYTSHEKISKTLGFFWLGSRFTSIETNDGIVLLVFVKGKHVVHYLEYGRKYDFAYVYKENGYAVNDSRFVLGEKSRMIRLPND